MKIEEKFNKRSAKLIDVQTPLVVHAGGGMALGIKLTATPERDAGSIGSGEQLCIHMTPAEALELAQQLINAARLQICKRTE